MRLTFLLNLFLEKLLSSETFASDSNRFSQVSKYFEEIPFSVICRSSIVSLPFLNPSPRNRSQTLQWPLASTYQAISSASVDLIWKKIADLTDVSWHPLIARTNVPYGLVAKPGLMYQAVSRLLPLRMQIFVERVRPGELLSVRILAIPGVEERVTYRIESSLCGTRISYSVMLRGWLSPLVWSLTRGYAARVANQLAVAAEAEGTEAATVLHWPRRPRPKKTCFDF